MLREKKRIQTRKELANPAEKTVHLGFITREAGTVQGIFPKTKPPEPFPVLWL